MGNDGITKQELKQFNKRFNLNFTKQEYIEHLLRVKEQGEKDDLKCKKNSLTVAKTAYCKKTHYRTYACHKCKFSKNKEYEIYTIKDNRQIHAGIIPDHKFDDQLQQMFNIYIIYSFDQFENYFTIDPIEILRLDRKEKGKRLEIVRGKRE